MKNSDVDLGRCISSILRHHPENFQVYVDFHGWADVSQLIANMNKHGKKIDRPTLDRIVRENNKKRYSYNKDGSKIRANQGHSFPVDLELLPVSPPEKLFHGTAEIFLDSIREKGILKMGRNHVHLSVDTETAINVGSRHGKPVILVIDTATMEKDGVDFFLSENNVWLCEYVNYKYVTDILYI